MNGLADFIGSTEFYIFLLAALLIGVVYYAGVKTDAGAFSALFNSGFNAVTGRNSNGQFMGVPLGSGAKATVTGA